MKNHQNEINHQAWKEIISLKSEMITMWGIYWKLFNHCMNDMTKSITSKINSLL